MKMSVREIQLSSEPGSAYFLRVDWSGRGLESGFQVLLTDGRKAWTGEVDEAAVRSEAEELEMETEHYVQDLQEVLTGTGGSAPQGGSAPYSFTLTPQPDAAAAVTLTYEKKQKDIAFRLGCVSLSLVSTPLEEITKLLRQNLRRGNELKLQNQKLTEENQKLKREQDRMVTRLESFAADKETLETELYTRFVLVLNEKKAKLRSLQETVRKLEERTGQKHESSCSDQADEYGGTTEEEEEEERPSTSNYNPAGGPSPLASLDDSLTDITDVAPNRKRRFRHLEALGGGATRGGRGQGAAMSVSHAGRSTEAAAASSTEDLFDDF